jgi:K+-transporting ATPase ATPase B chain
MSSYAELHCLSCYSFLRSASHPHELVERAAALGYRALAITDECSFAGIVKAHVAAKEAGIMVDLDSNPTKLIEIVEIGKQMLMTRGSLTTFSISNDVAKYFAIIPAAFATTYPQLRVLDVMHLASPASAILSAVIFNALIIVALIPLALKGVRYRPLGAAPLLRRNLLLYGLGGVLLPFPFIKLIDMVMVACGWA